MSYDFLVVGLGFAGAVAAERLAKAGKKVLAVEKRNHIGGNCYDHYDDAGILVHKYGPHIFHTNSTEVWGYLSQFAEWIPYEHKVLAQVDGKNISLPVNLNTIYELFAEKEAKEFEEILLNEFGPGQKIPILQLRKHINQNLRKLAEVVYDKVYLNYTKKQWEMLPEELDPQVTERVPLWTDRDDRYFKDKYQAMPKEGYTKMFEKMLDNPNIEVVLNKDHKEMLGKVDHQKMVYTGSIDCYFDYKYGELPYRSMDFKFETLGQEWFQKASVVNYPGGDPFIRITEFKHLSGQSFPKTTILREYPEEHSFEENIPCYPIPQQKNFEQYGRYKAEADKLENVAFVGRLAEYKYYNMDEVVGKVLRFTQNPS